MIRPLCCLLTAACATRRVILAVIFLVLSVTSAMAQAPNIAQYHQLVFGPGVDPQTGSPIWTNDYTATAATCNLVAPTVPATVTNPTAIFFDDQAHPGMSCQILIASTMLPAIPNGPGYVAVLTQTDNLGQTSARSAASNPFAKQGIPAVLTNVKAK